MAAPTPTVSFQGLGLVPADLLNTFVQVCVNYAQMRTFSGLSNMGVYALGSSTQNDGGQAFFYWSATATGPDNGSTIIMPSGNTTGAWILSPPPAPSSASLLAFFNSLPTTLPPTAGQLWWDGNVLARS